ncbi:LacI family DNA-binding transcriptional regulator [Pseudooceanicola sediminis]|nr:LacI family DNA-binding transcriptional regulator [Pseudooceanicola sediminis]|tara:strand:+ start:103996 stop:105051 length:1056 start_codon:yes stop_codon:yes gene_type:complete
MSKPTTRDLAAAAGVSLATVDRVLNGRDGVRQKTVDKVNDAIRDIGFVRDQTAATLARKRFYDFVFVLPDRQDEFLSLIVEAVDEASSALRHERVSARTVRVAANDPLSVVQTLEGLARDKVDGVAVMAPETPQTRDAIQRVKDRGISVVTFVADQPNAARDRYIGINDADAGRTAATLIGRFCRASPGAVLVVAETIQSRDSLDRRHGFDEVLQADFPHLHASPTIETYADPLRTERVLGNALAATPDLRAIYLMSSASAAALGCLKSHGIDRECVVIAHELTALTRQGLITGQLGAVITQDIGHLVRSALRVLRAKAENAPMVESQERIRIEILLQANLPRIDTAPETN